MANDYNLRPAKKGEVRNPNGRPKGAKNKSTQLKRLLKDLAKISDKLEGNSKQLAYDLYDIALSDYITGEYRAVSDHLYFIDSADCIKIGRSHKVDTRLKQIKSYAPDAEIIRVIPNAGAYEASLHKRLDRHNVRDMEGWGTEWFNKTEEVLTLVDRIQSITDLHYLFGSKEMEQVELIFRQ